MPLAYHLSPRDRVSGLVEPRQRPDKGETKTTT
jgi:hypothetical protein